MDSWKDNAPKWAIWIKEVMIWLLSLILWVQFFFDNSHELDVIDKENKQDIVTILLEQKTEDTQNFDKLYNLVLDVDRSMKDLENQVYQNSQAIEENQWDIQNILLKLQSK